MKYLLSVFFVILFSLISHQNAFAQTAAKNVSESKDNLASEAVLLSGKTAYALVARPLDVTMQRVDLVTFDPKTFEIQSRGEVKAIRCSRLHASVNGEVLCLSNHFFVKGRFELGAPYASSHNRDLSKQTSQVVQEKGIASRARMSYDSKYQAWTYFVTGHNYMDAGSGQFSTLTQIRDNKTATLHNLEQWPLTQNGKLVTSPDLNYWGVTFNPNNSQQFLVTAFFKGKPYLVSGNIASKTMMVIHEGVECPSYSPNGQFIAFKRRMSSTRWAPAVMELSSKKTTVLTQIKESIDDQIDWLNNKTLVFEQVNTPLVGTASIDLMRIDPFISGAKSTVWIKNARSAAVFIPK